MQGVETAVLIVGAGPVGLALANELGYRGVRCVLIERGEGEVPFPAGEGIFSRTMEHLRRWGLADRARHNPVFPDDYALNVGFATAVTGRLLALFQAPSNGAMPTAQNDSPEGILICPKMVFDPLLRQGAEARESVQLRYRTELLGFAQDADGVTARVKDLASGAEYDIRADYLAACDGARSAVRKQLAIPYVGSFGEGHNFAVWFRAPALRACLEKQFGCSLFQLHTVNTPRRPYLTAVDGRDQWRMSMYIEKGDDPQPLEAVQAAIGVSMPIEVVRAQPWAGHRVVAARYREGRAFLLGDAAHLRWPKGGFGANTGIGDAVDLGWKLAAVLQGWGGPQLLDSYERERRPIAIRNVNEASNNRTLDAAIEPDAAYDAEGDAADALRRQVENRIHALRLREFRTQGVQLGYRYRQSPLCAADDALEPPDDHMLYQPSTWPGGRAPHAWLADGRSTLDLFGRGFVLMCLDGQRAATAFADAAAVRGVPLREERFDDVALRALYERNYVLVRPDGHVAWRGDDVPADAGRILDLARGATTVPVPEALMPA